MIVRHVEFARAHGRYIVWCIDERMPNRSYMSHRLGIQDMVEQFNLGSSCRDILSFLRGRSKKVRVRQMVDSKDIDRVGMFRVCDDVDTVCNEVALEILKGEAAGFHGLIFVSVCCILEILTVNYH